MSTESLVESFATFEGSTVVDVGIGLYNPDEFLARVVEVELDLVGRGPDRFIASELELFDEVFVGVCAIRRLSSVSRKM